MFSSPPLKRLAAVAVCLGVLVPAIASAQPPPGAKQRAEQRYREGLELAKAGKNEAALAKFDEANGLAPSALATYQVARMEHALGHSRAALIGYRRALRDEGLPIAERSEALKAVEELKTKVGVITIESPPGAAITVDGNPIDDPKQPVEVAPGAHIIKATLGGESRVVDTTLEAGKVFVAKLSFEDTSAIAPAPTTTTGPSGSTKGPPAETPTPYWTTPRWIGVGLAGLSAVGIGFTVAFTLSHESNVSSQEDLAANPRVCADTASPGCRSFTDHGDSADTARTLAIVSGAVAGAAAIGAVILLWPHSQHSAKLVPGPGTLVFTQSF